MAVTDELPLGFSMALAKNIDAMRAFMNLSDEQKRAVINGTHSITSKAEMSRYVEKLVKNNNSYF